MFLIFSGSSAQPETKDDYFLEFDTRWGIFFKKNYVFIVIIILLRCCLLLFKGQLSMIISKGLSVEDLVRLSGQHSRQVCVRNFYINVLTGLFVW